MKPPRFSAAQARWLASIASRLAQRQEAILLSWRTYVDADPELTTPSSLPRTQFNDHIPAVLSAFASRLHHGEALAPDDPDSEHKEDSAAHGLQRWQQGYRLREVTREWGHLQRCILDELEAYLSTQPGVDPLVMQFAYRELAALCSDGVCESTTQYFQLQELEAEGHVHDLAKALDQHRLLERERAELLRQAAHDLRGNVGIVANATSGLSLAALPAEARDQLFRLLQRNVSSLHAMLDDVMNLARLQAGHEQREVRPFDVAALLRNLCEMLTPLATDRGLVLGAEGPERLDVEGDAVKTQRIAQNLLINALKYTSVGNVTVCWGDSREGDVERWVLSVRDTGPGFLSGPGAPIAGAIEEATHDALAAGQRAGESPEVPGEAGASPVGDSAVASDSPQRGEGVGLSIVKRLCELLDASIEVESKPGEGTVFRVLLPRHYPPVAAK